MVYRFENEQLVELINRTAHAGALSALVETASSYRFYFAVYVRNVGRFTPLYMTLIDPFRRFIVTRRCCARYAPLGADDQRELSGDRAQFDRSNPRSSPRRRDCSVCSR